MTAQGAATMKSLRFASAQVLLRHETDARLVLPQVSHDLYPLLFKVSFLEEQPEALRLVVRHWPLPILSVGQLLGRTPDWEQDLRQRTCRLCLQALLDGLCDYVRDDRSGPADTPVRYGRPLRLVDLTGLRDAETQECECGAGMGRWARTEALARACVEAQREEREAGALARHVEVLASAFVTQRNYGVVMDALRARGTGPLALRCMELRADSLPCDKIFELLGAVDLPVLRRLDLVHNVRMSPGQLEDLLMDFPMPALRAITFPTRVVDVNLHEADDPHLDALALGLAGLPLLQELNLPFSILTGHLRQLLSALQAPLRVLDLSGCELNHVDLAYLANSEHAVALEDLDLSGHSLPTLYPATFFKLLHRAALTLRSLRLEECDVRDRHVALVLVALGPCQRLQRLALMGNPMSRLGLRRLFAWLAGYPMLRVIEYPVPTDCFPAGTEFPPSDEALEAHDRQKLREVQGELEAILVEAKRGDIATSAPLYGSFDSDVRETGAEVGAFMISAFQSSLQGFLDSLKR